MGKRSVKANKNMFQVAREEMGLSRASASEQMEYISESRIEKIEKLCHYQKMFLKCQKHIVNLC